MGYRCCGLVGAFFVFYSSLAWGIRGNLFPETEEDRPDTSSMVSILKRDEKGTLHIKCSGTLIDAKRILTAAHCFDNRDYDILIGRRGEVFEIDHVSISQGYKREDLLDEYWGYVYDIKIENDFAIITLKKAQDYLAFSPLPKSISSPPLDSQTELVFSGFGQTDNIFGMGTGAGPLRSSAITYAKNWSEHRLRMEDGTTGTCQGDSGGPVWQKNEHHQWLQVGIISQGDCHLLTMAERISEKKLNQALYDHYLPQKESSPRLEALKATSTEF